MAFGSFFILIKICAVGYTDMLWWKKFNLQLARNNINQVTNTYKNVDFKLFLFSARKIHLENDTIVVNNLIITKL